MTNSTQPREFDERAALDELERLAERIQASRRQREQAVAEFDAFVKAFRDDQYATRLRAVESAAAQQQRAEPRTPPQIEARVPQPVEPVFPSESAPARERQETDEVERHAAPRSAAARHLPVPVARASSSASHASKPATRPSLLSAPHARLAIAAAGVLLLVLAIAWMRSGTSAPSQTAQRSTPSPAPAAASKPVAPSPPAPTPAPAPTRPLNVQLVTVRAVWARVTVDDKKVMEREIPAGQTIPLGADRTIAVRAGDAGAVRVIVDGKDLGPLGRDGFPATKTFAAPAAR